MDQTDNIQRQRWALNSFKTIMYIDDTLLLRIQNINLTLEKKMKTYIFFVDCTLFAPF